MIWLLKDGEHLPVQPNVRKMRMWLIADALCERGHSVLWWSSTFSHQRKMRLQNEATDVEVVPGFRLKLIDAGAYQRNISLQRYLHHRRLAAEFRRKAALLNRPDAIVCAFPTIELAYEAVAYARSRRVPIVVDVRDLWPDTFLRKVPRPLRRLSRLALRDLFSKTESLLRGADSVIAVSSGYLQWALRKAGRQRTALDRVFYLGSDDLGVMRSKRASNRPEARKVVFIFVGSFGHSYELELLCDVARRVVSAGLDAVEFLLVGDGEQYGEIARRAENLPNVRLTGWVNREHLRDLLSNADVGIAPCLHPPDSVPNKVFEYMAAGLPVISSLQGEMAELIAAHDVGTSYTSGDSDALFKTVVTLAKNPALRWRQCDNARRLFEERFSAERVYGELARHVEEVAMIRRA